MKQTEQTTRMRQHLFFDRKTWKLHLLDQRFLPVREEIFSCGTTEEIIHALKSMVVRGAPAIGVTGAWGCVIAAREVLARLGNDAPREEWGRELDRLLEKIVIARPTAVNLAWAVKQMIEKGEAYQGNSLSGLVELWYTCANAMQKDDVETNRRMGAFGARVIDQGDTVMTHCNAGVLATAGFGTALGVLYAAWEQGKKIRAIANETRPFLQGARLTAYELQKNGIPVTIACDNSCALLMQKGLVHKVVVGADRIAANGDVANKIGTYGVALLARAHNIPFYVAAPLSTIDLQMPDGISIPIEERPAEEVEYVGNTRITPEDVPVFNFAFDVTPADLVSGIITERGILLPPYKESIVAAFAQE